MRLAPVLKAVLSVFPLDADVARPAMRARIANAPDTPDQIHIEIEAALQTELDAAQIDVGGGPAFFDRVEQRHTILATSEQEPFANVILRKAVVSHPK